MLSAFDIFKIGIGPSSSHTVGPMRAALLFAQSLERRGLLAQVARLHVDLFGSLGATGHGHATDQGVILGLFGDAPDTVRPETVQPRLDALRRSGQLSLLGTTPIAFDRVRDIAFRGEESLPEHPNAMRFTAFAADGAVLAEGTYFSVGGGFVVEGGQAVAQTAAAAAAVAWGKAVPAAGVQPAAAEAARTVRLSGGNASKTSCRWAHPGDLR